MKALLRSKVSLVTGCNRGIGQAIAQKFAANGSTVYANARAPGSLDQIEPYGSRQGSIIPIYFDVTDRNAVREAIIRIKREHGRVDCLVNNAGLLIDTRINMLNRATLEKIYEVNVFALFDLISLVSRLMIRAGSGSITNIASICGDEGGLPGQTAYSSSKGAVIALTKTAAKELGEFNVRVNCVSPGFIDTDMFRSGPKKIQDQLIQGVHLGKRVGTSEEVAEACLFLASDKASYVNGTNLRVDGFAHI